MRRMSKLLMSGTMLAVAASFAVAVHAQSGGRAKAQAMQNPVPPTAASITAGMAAFEKYCAFCHGVDAKGNGRLAPEGSNPPDLTDETWTYGSTDGEIFSVMADGLDGSVMIPIRGRMPDQDLWHIINYLHTLGSTGAAR